MNKILVGDSQKIIKNIEDKIDLTFLDPPFNQGKDYEYHDDSMSEEDYWNMMEDICRDTLKITNDGGALYFMQREKNCENVLRVLGETGWIFQNLIIWKKFTSAAAPSEIRHAKHYQIIAYVTKGGRPKTFNKLRIDPPRLAHHKYDRKNGMFVTDLWDDIKELTAGCFSGDEPILKEDNKTRFHKQQSPIALLTRIILTSSNVGDWVFDPFAGTGTTACVANQLKRHCTSIDIDPSNVKCIENRINKLREQDDVSKYKKDYRCTEKINFIWGNDLDVSLKSDILEELAAISPDNKENEMDSAELAVLSHENLLDQVEDILVDILDVELVISYKEYKEYNIVPGRIYCVQHYPYEDIYGATKSSSYLLVNNKKKCRLHCMHQNKGANFDKQILYMIGNALHVEGSVVLAFIGPGFTDGAKKHVRQTLAEQDKKIQVFWDLDSLRGFLTKFLT